MFSAGLTSLNVIWTFACSLCSELVLLLYLMFVLQLQCLHAAVLQDCRTLLVHSEHDWVVSRSIS